MVSQLQGGVAFLLLTKSTILLWKKNRYFWVHLRVRSSSCFQIPYFQAWSVCLLLLHAVVMRNTFLRCDVSWWISVVLFIVFPQLHCSNRFFFLSFLHSFAFSRSLQVLCTLAVLLHFFLSGLIVSCCYALVLFSFLFFRDPDSRMWEVTAQREQCRLQECRRGCLLAVWIPSSLLRGQAWDSTVPSQPTKRNVS